MYGFLLRTIVSSILGGSFYQWWQGTKIGIWFQKHLDRFLQYLADKYNIEIAKKDAKFQKQFPLIAKRLRELEKHSHAWDPDKEGQITTLDERVKLLEHERRIYHGAE